MHVLALETSQRQASLAALGEKGTVLACQQLSSEQRTAKSLTPAIQNLLAEVAWKPQELDLICVATGPGSFTGLRIGVVTAKTLAYATGAKLVGIHTLSALAARIAPQPSRLWAILDAQRQELFAACLTEKGITAPEAKILKIESWLELLQTGDVVTGPPLAKLSSRLPQGVEAAPLELWNPSAIEVGQLGIEAFKLGKEVDPMQLVPEYFRRSAAEEKAELGSA